MMTAMVFRAFLGSFLASIGFAVLFNIHGRLIFFAGLAGALGGAFFQGILDLTQSQALANFIGAVSFSLASEILARKLKTTVTTFTAPALIPLVPGGTIYKMMVQLLENNIYSGLQYGVEALLVAGSLALGMMLVATLSRLLFWLNKKLAKLV